MKNEPKVNLLEVLKGVVDAKNMDDSVVLGALKQALIQAARKYLHIEKKIDVDIDTETNEVHVILRVEVVDDFPDYDPNLTAEEVDVDSASGSVQVIGNAKEVNIDTASGDIYLDGMAEELELNTASGKIEVNENGKLKRANIGTASGDVKVAAKTFDDMDIDTASGKVTLQLPADSNFTLHMDTASGDFRSDLALKMDGKKYVCGNGKGMIKIDTASGDIFLKEN